MLCVPRMVPFNIYLPLAHTAFSFLCFLHIKQRYDIDGVCLPRMKQVYTLIYVFMAEASL